MQYKRILLKMSGESLRTEGGENSISNERLSHYAGEVKSLLESGVEVGLVMARCSASRNSRVTMSALSKCCSMPARRCPRKTGAVTK